MTKRIFASIGTVAILVFLASLILILTVLQGYYSNVQKEQMKLQTSLVAEGVELSGIEYLKQLAPEEHRITWISPDGKVLYDTVNDETGMENHMDREEVKEAFADGYGESSRMSSTMTRKLFYSAKKLNDGTVIRVADARYSIWLLLFGILQPLLLVSVFAILISLFLAHRLSKRIVDPINQLDLDHPLETNDYPEIYPLQKRLAKQQEQIAKDKEKLESMSIMRRDFTANVSHELKTPIQTISGYAELMQNGMVESEDLPRVADRLYSESRRMSQLVEDILELSQLESEVDAPSKEAVDVYAAAQNAVESLAFQAEQSDVTLELTGDHVEIIGVPEQIYTILYNLCDNAIRYNRPGGSVTVRVANEPVEAVIEVTDTGIGIPEEDYDRIFERFYQVDKSHSREVGGTGLGLSIVKHAVGTHNGTIRVESVENAGSTFTVTLPKA
ncbi:MAG: PAS domain-containing sensor histidine kinase [Clostridia bacterium]|nr:PAS domain-containing sensor histidine kinase [Clostridia bacterium]MBQ8926525.1 PAS domain-containing sensor histidine kinase [Clostridia bacterium]